MENSVADDLLKVRELLDKLGREQRENAISLVNHLRHLDLHLEQRFETVMSRLDEIALTQEEFRALLVVRQEKRALPLQIGDKVRVLGNSSFVFEVFDIEVDALNPSRKSALVGNSASTACDWFPFSELFTEHGERVESL